MVGSTFAFFTASVTGGGQEDTAETATSIQSASLSVNYSEGPNVNLSDQTIMPSWTGSKTITITNNSEVDVDYTIKFLTTGDPGVDEVSTKAYDNTFTDLKYTLEDKTVDKSNSTVEAKYLVSNQTLGAKSLKGTDDADKNVLVSGHLGAKKSYTFLLTLTFEDTNDEQNAQQGATFTGKLYAEAFTAKPVTP